MNKKIHHLFKDTHEKALASTYVELYEMVKQAAAKAIYLRGAYGRINKKAGELAEFQDLNQYVLHQLIQ